MVKKLLKYEILYYLRTFGAFLPIALVVALTTRVSMFFESDSVVSDIMMYSSLSMLYMACFALIILPTVVGVVRFYKNMYSAEGYLTFVLPITNAQHILVKLLGLLGCYAICILTVVAAAFIAISGEAFVEVKNVIGTIIDGELSKSGAADVIIFSVELFVLMILTVVSNMLLYYGCITVGQTAKKNRILAAVGAYFVYYAITQFISTIFTFSISLGTVADIFWNAMDFFSSAHLYLCARILLNMAKIVLFWFITQAVMTKKLNLE